MLTKLLSILISFSFLTLIDSTPSESLRDKASKFEAEFSQGAGFLIKDGTGTVTTYYRFPEGNGLLVEVSTPTEGKSVKILDGENFFSATKAVDDEKWTMSALISDSSPVKEGLLLSYDRMLKAPWALVGKSYEQVLDMPNVTLVENEQNRIVLESQRDHEVVNFSAIPFALKHEKAMISIDSEGRILEFEKSVVNSRDGNRKFRVKCTYGPGNTFSVVESSADEIGESWQIEPIDHDWNDRSILAPSNYGFSWPPKPISKTSHSGWLSYILLAFGIFLVLIGSYFFYRQKYSS